MKTKIPSLLVPALLVAGAANAAEIYNKDGNKLDLHGKADGLHYFSDDPSKDDNQACMRTGFKGETQVSNQLTGYSQWEHQIQGNAPEPENSSWTRVASAGLKPADVGSFDYGHSYDVIHDVMSWTDAPPEFGGDTYGSNNFMQQCGNGFATYCNTDLFGLADSLNFTLQYQGKNGNLEGEGMTGVASSGCNALRQNGDGAGGPITYDTGEGLTLGTIATSSKHIDGQNKLDLGTGNRAKTYTGDPRYNADNVYLVAQYTQIYNATRTDSLGWTNKAQNFEATVQYQSDFGLRPPAVYLQSKGRDLSNGLANYGDQDILKYVDVDATYYFSKNMLTYAGYKISLLGDDQFIRDAGISTDDIVALGLAYQF